MAYPFTTPVPLSVSQSIDSIAASEASILEGLNQILCEQFVRPILTDAALPTPTLTLPDRVALMSSVLNSMAVKECSVASVLNGLADAINAQVPAGSSDCQMSCKCDC